MQLVYISNRPRILAGTLAYVRAFMPFIDDIVVFCPASDVQAMRSIDAGLRVLDERTLLGDDPARFAGSSDHQRRNYLLRAGLGRFGDLCETFVMSDDDARPLRPIADDYFVHADGRHQPFFFHDLGQWEGHLGRRRTSFDAGMLNTRDALAEAGLGSLAFSAHMPQVIDRALFRQSVEFFTDALERFGSLAEWDTYFNFALDRAPGRFLPPRPFTVLGWPDGPHWPWLVPPAAYDFENFAPANYVRGSLFDDLSNAFDPATHAADAEAKISRYRCMMKAGLARKARRTKRRRLLAPGHWQRKLAGIGARLRPHPPVRNALSGRPEPPFAIAGLFSLPTGLGNAATILSETMARTDLAGDIRNLDLSAFFDRSRPETERIAPIPDPEARTLVVAVNPPQAREYLRALPRAAVAGKKLVGYWWWEFPSFPERWEAPLEAFDEVWVSSPYIHANWSDRLGARLRLVPLDLRLAGRAGTHPLPDLPVRMLSLFNLGSTAARKNPLAAIELFRILRRDFGAKVEMTLKVGGLGRHPQRYADLLAAIGPIDEGLTLIVGDLAQERIDALFERHAIYVSLHRAEGLGLPLVQAMLAEKVTVATAWSGNTAFMTDQNSVLVDYSLTEMEEGNGNTSRLVTCAEPVIADAAARVGSLIDAPDLRHRIGQAARRDMEALGEAAARTMAEFLRGDPRDGSSPP